MATMEEQSDIEQQLRESLPEHAHKTPIMIQAQFVTTLLEQATHE